MNEKIKVKIEKCWSIQVIDENDNILDSDICFGSHGMAKIEAHNLKQKYIDND